MFLGIAVVALAQAGAPDITELRPLLERGIEGLESSVSELARNVATGGNGSRPRTGILLSSEDEGPGGLVVAVMQGSPAAKAGIAAGDRITAISGRVLENETLGVMRFILDDAASPLPLTLRISRDGTVREKKVGRMTLACLVAATRDLDQDVWRGRIISLRTVLEMQRKLLDDPEVPVLQRYLDARRRLNDIHAAIQEISSLLEMELAMARWRHCGAP